MGGRCLHGSGDSDLGIHTKERRPAEIPTIVPLMRGWSLDRSLGRKDGRSMHAQIRHLRPRLTKAGATTTEDPTVGAADPENAGPKTQDRRISAATSGRVLGSPGFCVKLLLNQTRVQFSLSNANSFHI